MKIALCTTTIHVPHALKLLRKCSPDVRFFVAADLHTPQEAFDLVNELGGWIGIGHEWKCSQPIDFRTLARRNIAFLEAVKWGADVIYSWDNDNIPTSPYHFVPFDGPWVFDGIKVTGSGGWFDSGRLLIPPTRHRGFPHDKPLSKCVSHVTNAKIGVHAGLVIGDPDCDAVTRMEHRPDIGQVHILGSTGVVVDPGTWTVFNSQNTAVIRELIPAWFMMQGVGRMDDIYAALIVQRIARDRGYHVHFGPPFTYQQRNEHNLLTDLRAEIDGMERVEQIAAALDRVTLPDTSVVDQTHVIYDWLRDLNLIGAIQHKAAVKWLEDVESVL